MALQAGKNEIAIVSKIASANFSERGAIMKRRIPFITAALVFLAVMLPLLKAQDVKSLPSPAVPSEILGPQLIAWSQLQRPQPIPEPMPSPSRAAAQQPTPSGDSAVQQQAPAAQTFTGTIVKDGARYILKAAGTNVYQLDDQERARQYEGKQVKIAGTLDATGNSLHVTSIELLS